MALVQDYVTGQMPGDDSYLPITLLQQLVDVAFDVSWAQGADGWADAVPWPSRYPIGSGAVTVGTVTSAVAFTLVRDNGNYATPAPVAGMNIAFFDGTTGGGVFR